jgi:hypothetical protein
VSDDPIRRYRQTVPADSERIQQDLKERFREWRRNLKPNAEHWTSPTAVAMSMVGLMQDPINFSVALAEFLRDE